MELLREIQDSVEARRILEVGETFYNYYDFYHSSMDGVVAQWTQNVKFLSCLSPQDGHSRKFFVLDHLSLSSAKIETSFFYKNVTIMNSFFVSHIADFKK
jgi:hypothetical protein